jgi:3-methyladenine DNA glycosylase AlkC
MQSSFQHPSRRFRASANIQKGEPLKRMFDRRLVELIAEAFASVVPGFDAKCFRASAVRGLRPLGLLERSARIAAALMEQLPADFDEAGPLLIAALGPPLTATEGNGLAPFFYMPYAHVIAERGVARFASGMRANYELTRRFTAEFSIRPFVVEHQRPCLKLLAKWAADPDPHVRRLVSEGTRPRLPWAMRLRAIQEDPGLVLPLLEKLKDDPVLYVRRSVANHLGDIAKDHPQRAFEVCRKWIDEVDRSDAARAEARLWIVRHALRLPARQGNKVALKLRNAARPTQKKASRTR